MALLFADPSSLDKLGEDASIEDFVIVDGEKAISGYNAFMHPHTHPDVIDDSLESPSPKKKGFLASIKNLVVTKKKKK
jgi:hypothetical protein